MHRPRAGTETRATPRVYGTKRSPASALPGSVGGVPAPERWVRDGGKLPPPGLGASYPQPSSPNDHTEYDSRGSADASRLTATLV